ncbi:MAG: peroxiredoxin [Puniceicoccales bacterium]|jgi:peroxiredoxin (alkyl hydroperoxide reductase subunit C)|nr:peroxiredoxin [Puniceicoccales bacterium]
MYTCHHVSTLVGQKAPLFTANAVINGNQIVEKFSLEKYLGNQYIVLFFYPKDFTFVCPTELHAFQESLKEFENRSTQVIACSTDSEFSHWAWLQMPKKEGGIQGVTYPIVADVNKTITNDYGILAGTYYYDEQDHLQVEGTLVAYRGLFLIDKQGIIQHQVVNNMPLGRSVQETLRMVDALQHFETYGEVCPINWHKGKTGMQPTHKGVKDFFK